MILPPCPRCRGQMLPQTPCGYTLGEVASCLQCGHIDYEIPPGIRAAAVRKAAWGERQQYDDVRVYGGW